MNDHRFGEKYRTKASNLENCIGNFGISSSTVLKKYENDLFVDGVGKIEIFRQILSGSPDQSTLDYLDRRCTEGFGHYRGDRSGAEYAADLILGWIQEDTFLEVFVENGLLVELAGHDSGREFLKPGEISSNSDLLVSFGDNSRKVELAYDSTGFWRKKGQYDMRDSKYRKLTSEQAIIFGVAIPSAEAFVIDLSAPNNYEIEYIPFHFIYKKPAFQLQHVAEILTSIPSAISLLKSIL